MSILNYKNIDNQHLKEQDFSEDYDHVKILRINESNLTTIDNIFFPINLIELNISNNNLTNVNMVRYPHHLEILNLSNNKIINFDFKLTNIDLSHNNLTHTLLNIIFPETLETLILCSVGIDCFDNFVFPLNLLELILASNNITSINKIKLPPKL